MLRKSVNSFFNSNSFLIGDCLIDSGDAVDAEVNAVLLTHAHFDHIYGLNELLRKNPEIRVFTNEAGRLMLFDPKLNLSAFHDSPFTLDYPDRIVTVTDGEEVVLGDNLSAKAIFTPGHSPSCITWLIGDCLFTGDAYIPGTKTITTLPGGNKTAALRSEALIKDLAVGRTICPGHTLA